MQSSIRRKNTKWFILYFVVVVALLTACFVWLNANDRVMMFMDIGADTYCDGWPRFEAAIRWWKNFPVSLWDYTNGLGSSFASNSATLFNPFVVILYLCGDTLNGINLMIFFEYVTLSLAAYVLYREMGLDGGICVVVALCHTFCGFMVGWGQHYTFGSMFVFYTVMQFGFERYLQTGKWALISFCVAVIGGMYVYFLYMILIFSAIWWSIRFFTKSKQRNIKQYFLFGIKLCGVVLVGILLCLPSFSEQVKLLLNAARVNGDLDVFNFQIANSETLITTVYRSFSNILMGINEMPYGSNFYEAPILYTGLISWFGIIGYIVYWSKRKSIKGLMFLFALLFVVLFPNLLSVVFNGFSTSTPRWYFVFVPIQCYLTGKGIQCLYKDRKTLTYTLILTTIVLLCAGYFYAKDILPMFTIEPTAQKTALLVLGATALLFIIVFAASKKCNNISYFLLAMIISFEMGTNGFLSTGERTLSKTNLQTPGYWATTGYFDGTQEALLQIKERDDGFYRIAKNYNKVDLLAPQFQNYYGETYYYPAASSYSYSLIQTFGLNVPNSNYFYGFDGKQELRNLYGAKYLLTKEELNYANYSLIGKSNGIYIYLNENCVGLSTFYSKTTKLSDYRMLSMPEKNDLLYTACAVNDNAEILIETIGTYKEHISIEPIDYVITEKSAGVIAVNLCNTIDGSIEIEFNNRTNYSGKISVYYSCGEEMTEGKKVDIWLPVGSQTVSIMEKNVLKMKIVGDPLLLDTLEMIVRQRDDAYIQDATACLRESGMKIDEFSEQKITGSIMCDMPGVLVFAINYSDGWKVLVDGENTNTLICNEAFVGVPLSSGKHTIELSYHPDLFFFQVFISISTGIILVLCCVVQIIKEKKRK